MPWEDPELDVDEDGLIAQVLDGIRTRIEGWEPNEGAPEVALGEEIGVAAAAINAFVIDGFRLALAAIGETVFRVVPRTESYAVVDMGLGLRSSAIPPGAPPTTEIAISIPAGFAAVRDDVTFQTTADFNEIVTFNRLMTSTGIVSSYIASLTVEMQATVPGTIGNVAGGGGSNVVLVTSHPYVTHAGMNSHASGGVDGESLTEYLDRLTDYLSTLRPGSVRAADLATLARTVNGVERALAIDLLGPGGGIEQRTATVIAIDAAGEAVDGVTLAEMISTLELSREVNFNLIYRQPTYTGIDIAVVVHPVAGVDLDLLEDQLTATLAQVISPATWGATADHPKSWTERTVLRVLDVAAVVAQVPGVESIESLTLNGSSSSTTLEGPGALPSSLDAESDPSSIVVGFA